MKPWDQLTARGRVIHLREVARQALASYDLGIEHFSLLGNFTNTLFKVESTRGERLVLRLCTPGWRTEEDLRSEAMWLQSLEAYPDIGAPQVVANRRGEFLFSVQAKDAPKPYFCMLMSWIPGRILGKHLTLSNLRKMGDLFARLHIQSASYEPPARFTQRRMSHYLARGEEDVLFSPICEDAFTPHSRDVVCRVLDRVLKAFAYRYAASDGLRVIHNDLWHGNIKIDHGLLRPFDFEDTLWGYPVQDIAMAMQDLMTDVASHEFDPLLAAFRTGYEVRCPWPETYPEEMDTFRAGRMLWVCNYVARYERPYLRQHLDRVIGMFSHFLDTGFLRKLP